MSEAILAPLVTVAIIVALVLWVPTLHICGAGCQKLLRRRSATSHTEPVPALEQVTSNS